MNAEEKDKFRRRINAYAKDYYFWHDSALPVDHVKRLQRRADRLIEDIYYAGFNQAYRMPPSHSPADEAGVADVMEFHTKAAHEGKG